MEIEMSDYFEQLMESPSAVLDNSFDLNFTLSRGEIDAFHKHWVAKRFAELKDRILFLGKLAEEHDIDEITEVDDVLPLLFGHTVYKSYPMSYLERNRFDKLTKWLAGLITIDISHVDASAVTGIDEWMDLLDRETPLMLFNSSGTTGKLSFLPRTREQATQIAIMTSNMLRDWKGAGSRPDMLKQHRPFINPGYLHGGGTGQRMAGIQAELYAGGIENALFLYPEERMSADIQSLAGRIRVAEAKGELGSLEISPALLQRRAEFIARERNRPQAMEVFLNEAIRRFSGQDVYIGAVYGLVLDWAEDGLKRGRQNIFGSGSFLASGGGTKGRIFPENWQEMIADFLGFNNFFDMYAMTECTGMAGICEAGKYHLPVTTVPFLLDPRSGSLLPRRDGTTGRFAFFDLIPETFWAAIITGDKVTMSGWQKSCECGRTGCYVDKEISRYSAEEGGDDKVLCSGAPEAHNSALDFLISY
jgi:hypothetical protein